MTALRVMPLPNRAAICDVDFPSAHSDVNFATASAVHGLIRLPVASFILQPQGPNDPTKKPRDQAHQQRQ